VPKMPRQKLHTEMEIKERKKGQSLGHFCSKNILKLIILLIFSFLLFE